MGSRLLPVLLVLALVAGGAFWWVSSRDSARTGAPISAARTERAADEPRETVELSPPAPAPVPVQPSRVAVTPVEPDVAPAAEKTSGFVVRGRVTDRFGNAVPGARVIAASGAGLEVDLETEVDLPWMERVRATSDAKGIFELPGIEPGTIRLAVRAHGFAPFQREGIRVPAAADTVEIEPVVLTLGAILSGRVVDPSGNGVAGAKLIQMDIDSGRDLFFFNSRREPTAVSGEGGIFRIDELACGPWRFLVRHEDHPDLTVEGIAERPGEELSGLTWRLAHGATISGTVVDVPAAERGKLEARAVRRDENSAPFGLAGGRSAPVDESGAFTLRGLEVGSTYELQARLREQGDSFWERSRSESVSAQAGNSGVVLSYQPEAAITFQVFDAATRLPLERFRVEAGVRWTESLRDDDGRIRELHPEGRVRVGGLRPSRADDRVLLSITATGYREHHMTDIALSGGQELDLGAILLEPVPLVRVHVLDEKTGEPVPDALVRLEKQLSDQHFSVRRSIEIDEDAGTESIEFGESRSGRTDENGVAELTSYEGDTCAVLVTSKEHAPYRSPPLALPHGDSIEHEVRLRQGGSALVRVLDADGLPLAGAGVRHRAPSEQASGQRMMMIGGPRGAGEVTDAEGEILFEQLEGGVHAFRLDDEGGGPAFVTDQEFVIAGLGSDNGEDWTEVQVTEGETAEVTLQASPRGSLAGRVREAGAWLVGATLRLTPKRESGADSMSVMIPGFQQGDEARSDGEGRYRIDDVKRGTYLLSVSHPTRRMPQEFEIEIRTGENVFDVELPVSTITGRILDPEGDPIAGVRVWAERAPTDEPGVRRTVRMIMMVDDGGDASVTMGGMGGDSAYTDEEGRYLLRGVESDVDLLVKAEGDEVQPGSSEPLRVRPDEEKERVDLVLEGAGSISVEAVLADGGPARMCMVRAEFADESAGVEPKFAFIESGSTTLRGLKPGLWRVNVQRAGPNQNGQDEGTDQEVEVKVGETASSSFRMD